MKPFISLFLLFFLLLSSCAKKEIRILKKGKWDLVWNRDFVVIKGVLNFKGNGNVIFYPENSKDKVPCSYTFSGSQATFQFDSPNGSNTVHTFDVVTANRESQVWEEKSSSFPSTFIITK